MEHYIFYCKLSLLAVLSLITACCMLSRRWFVNLAAQRLGNFEAYGPILLGLNAPINDLSRGCNAAEVYSMAIITAALA